jgi:hypothetical protein
VLTFNGRAAGAFRVGIKGWAWLVGTALGHSATAYADGTTKALVGRLLDLCQVETLRAGELLLRKRVSAAKQAWFVTNPTRESVTETIAINAENIEDLLGEPIEKVAQGIRLTVAPLDVRVLVAITPSVQQSISPT